MREQSDVYQDRLDRGQPIRPLAEDSTGSSPTKRNNNQTIRKGSTMSHRTSQVSPPRQPSNGSLPVSKAQHVDTVAVSEEAIAKRAYEKFIARGSVHGFDQEDWAGAKQELNAELGRESLRLNKTAS